MAITRFDRFTPRDYSMQWYVPQEVMPNIEAWSNLLSEQQQKYDTTKMLLSEKMPRYLQTEYDRELLGKYKNIVDESLKNITTEYQTNGVSAGNRAMKEAARMFTREWQPGGMASALEDRYSGYHGALKEIEESYKKDTRGINKQFATSNLREQLNKPIGYNPETGEYQRISTPELYQDPGIQKLILEAIKGVEESGDTDIVRLSPTMLKKIKTEGRSAEVMQNIAEAVYSQYPKQVAIEAWYRGQQTTPEALRSQYESEVMSGVKSNQDLFDNLSTLSKDKVRKIQSDLVKQGYDLKIDGIAGDKTKQALKEYNDKVRQSANEQLSNYNQDNYLMSKIQQDYNKLARQFANLKRDESIIFDQAELTRQRIAASRRNTNALISGFDKIVNPETNAIGVTPDKGVNIEAWDKQWANASKTLNDAKSLYDKFISSGAGKILGTDSNSVSALIDAYERTGGDPNAFYNLIQKDDKYKDSRLIDLRKAFDYIQTNHDTISDVTNAYTQAQNQHELIKSTQDALTKQYSEAEGKKDFDELKRKYKKPWETDEQFRQAINNRDARFNKREYVGKEGEIDSNLADEYLKERNESVKKNPEYAKSIRTFEITSDNSDKAFGPFQKSILADIDNNDYYGYVDEDAQGFSWKTKSGDEKEGRVDNKKISIVSFGEKGKPQIKVTGVIKGKEGEKDTEVETYLDVPETRNSQLKQVLLATKAQAKRTKDNYLDEVSDLALSGISGDINYNKVTAQDNLKLHLENTEDIPIITPIYNSKGEIVNTRGTKMRGVKMEEDEINGRVYHKYKVLDDNGGTYYRLTMDTPKGEVIVPNKNGGLNFNSSSAVDVYLNGKAYDSELPVISTIEKVPQGQFIAPAQIGQMIQSGNQVNEELLNEDFNELDNG